MNPDPMTAADESVVDVVGKMGVSAVGSHRRSFDVDANANANA